MTYHHLRNATAVIEMDNHFVLVDPMLGNEGTIEAFTETRFPPLRNPLVDMPDEAEVLLEKVTHVLITHLHADHLDEAGISLLRNKQWAVTCSVLDEKDLTAKGLNVVQSLDYNQASPFLGGTIEGVPAQHGYGKVVELMGNVMGFYIDLPNQPSLYLASDTILTNDVASLLKSRKPDVSVIPCGSAQLDEHEPILMTIEDILSFVNLSTGLTICNHLEALNHCPTTRLNLNHHFKTHDLLQKTWIPEDGASKIL